MHPLLTSFVIQGLFLLDEQGDLQLTDLTLIKLYFTGTSLIKLYLLHYISEGGLSIHFI